MRLRSSGLLGVVGVLLRSVHIATRRMYKRAQVILRCRIVVAGAEGDLAYVLGR